MEDSILSYAVLEFYAWNPKWEHFIWNSELVKLAKTKNKKTDEDGTNEC